MDTAASTTRPSDNTACYDDPAPFPCEGHDGKRNEVTKSCDTSLELLDLAFLLSLFYFALPFDLASTFFM